MRKIKLTLAALLASIPLAGCVSKVDHLHPDQSQIVQYRDTEANKFLQSFPTQIPGAQRVEKFPFPNAQHLLVHLRQAHPFLDDPENRLREVEISQTNIYKTLEFIHSELGLNYIYPEGVLVENLESHNRTLDNLREHKKWKKENGYMTASNKRRSVSDASREICTDNEISYRASGTKKTEEVAVKAILKPFHTIWDLKKIDDARENDLLDLASQDAVAYTVFGDAHCWYNNIQEWNSKNPSRAYSLIEITPADN